MAKSVFTESVLDELRALAPIDWKSAQSFAAERGLKPRQIVGAAKRHGIQYDKQVRVAKTGAPVVSKADLVSQIADKFEKDVDRLDGLEKSTKTALEYLLAN